MVIVGFYCLGLAARQFWVLSALSLEWFGANFEFWGALSRFELEFLFLKVVYGLKIDFSLKEFE